MFTWLSSAPAATSPPLLSVDAPVDVSMRAQASLSLIPSSSWNSTRGRISNGVDERLPAVVAVVALRKYSKIEVRYFTSLKYKYKTG